MSRCTENERPAWEALLVALLAISACQPPPPAIEPSLEDGVVIEEVEAGGPAAAAGLEVGDRLIGWHRETTGGERLEGLFPSLFEVHNVSLEHGGFGPVTLELERRGRRQQVSISGLSWRLRSRPPLAGAERDAYLAALARLDAGEVEAGYGELEALAEGAAGRGERELELFFLWRRAMAHRHHRHPDVGQAFDRAVELARRSGDMRLEARILAAGGYALQAHHRQAEAVAMFDRSLALYRSAAPDSLVLANSIDQTGLAKLRAGERQEGLQLLEEAHALRQRLAPSSLAVAHSLNNLANYVKDAPLGEQYHEQSLAIRQRLVPGSTELAMSLSNLGLFAWQRDDLSRAEELLEQSRALFLELDPGGRSLVMVSANLALVALERGNLARAEERIRPTLEYFERQDSGGELHAEAWNILGTVLKSRRSLEAAESAFLVALEILEAVAPDSLRVGNAFSNLGGVAALGERLEQAETYYRRAIAVLEERALSPRELGLARVGLGGVLERQGRLAEAETTLERGLGDLNRLAPNGQSAAAAMVNLGRVVRRQGEAARAEALYRQALAIAERLIPDSYLEAVSHKGLADTLHEQGRIDEALRSYDRALGALEAQIGRLGGSEEDRIGYRASVRDFYRDYIDLLLAAEEPEAAFAVLERSRAQGFLALLAERDLVFARDLPSDLERERRRLGRELDRLTEEIHNLPPAESAALEERLSRRRELRRRRAEIRRQVRRTAPRLAELENPTTLDLAAAGEVLGGETTALSFDVGRERTHLFIVGAGGRLRVHTVEIGAAELGERVKRLRDLISAGRRGVGPPTALRRRASELYELLIRPAAEEVEAAAQLVIVPDGPLHALPFAVLERSPAADGETGTYLVEWRPLRFAVSLSTYAELERLSPPDAELPDSALYAFGDPELPAAGSEEEGSRAAPDRLAPLPFSRQEVLAIARSIESGDASPGGGRLPARARTFLGREASEARALSLSGRVPLLHFATHGLLDERFPLDSALLLSQPSAAEANRYNGMLQAWEVVEQVRIETELAVLSACETARGGELAGEGLSGLTRAFHFAGARSVLASLWRVSDRSTTVLMTLFYDHLARGLDPNRALRSAQLELVRGPVSLAKPQRWWRRGGRSEPFDASHPYHWAGFQLYGPGRPAS